jgi:hypothetical protein
VSGEQSIAMGVWVVKDLYSSRSFITGPTTSSSRASRSYSSGGCNLSISSGVVVAIGSLTWGRRISLGHSLEVDASNRLQAPEPWKRSWSQCLSSSTNERPSAFKPHSRRHQAECTSRLWSHIESVIGRSTLDDQVLYLVRWKACWTPRSFIEDGDWLGASLKVNRNPQCQRSSRLEQTAEARGRRMRRS